VKLPGSGSPPVQSHPVVVDSYATVGEAGPERKATTTEETAQTINS
jgi:hypothetical protein